MPTTVRVIQGRLAESEPHRTSAIEATYQHFRLDKQGILVSPKRDYNFVGTSTDQTSWQLQRHWLHGGRWRGRSWFRAAGHNSENRCLRLVLAGEEPRRSLVLLA